MKDFGKYRRRGAFFLTAAAMAAMSMITMVGLPAMSSPFPAARPKSQATAARENTGLLYAGPGPGVDFEQAPIQDERPARQCASRGSTQPDLVALD